MTTFAEDIDTLKETLLYELTKAFALPQAGLTKALVRAVFGRAAQAAAKVGIGLDRAVAEGGLAAGSRWVLPRFVKSHEARGVENIPVQGPLLIVSNHPASIDSVVISAYINRADYKVIIGDIPFFKHLPHVCRNAIFAPDPGQIMGRMQTVRAAVRHLKSGGSLLIFPRGEIEPDPDFMLHPDEQFHHWSRSLEIFLQHIPGLQILITIAGGVISPSTFHHPITWFRRARPDRQRIAFLYQLARQMLSGREFFGLRPRVTFGEIIAGRDHTHLLVEIEHAARRTLQRHLAWKYV